MWNQFKTFLLIAFFSGTALATENLATTSPLPKAPQVDVCDFVDLESCD